MARKANKPKAKTNEKAVAASLDHRWNYEWAFHDIWCAVRIAARLYMEQGGGDTREMSDLERNRSEEMSYAILSLPQLVQQLKDRYVASSY